LDFFIGARDAGLICKASFRTGARRLKKLLREGKLKLLTERNQRLPFHAFEYRLIETLPAPEEQTVSGNTDTRQLP
jgi:hypothetical protein